MNNNIWSFIMYVCGIIFICFFILIIGYALGGKSNNSFNQVPFESGIDSVGTARLRLSIKFYLIAMFFVIFDVESVYLYSWSIVVREVGWYGFIEATMFIFTLLLSLLYLIKINALDWAPKRLKKI